MKIYRIAPSEFGSPESAFSGKGSVGIQGRWNYVGHRVVYGAESLALGVLEKLVHVGDPSFMEGYVWLQAEIPDEVMETPSDFPAGWDASIPTAVSMEFGTRWIVEKRTLALRVPSVIVPEWNVMVNPLHGGFASVQIQGPFPLRWDKRFGKLFQP